MKKKERLIDRLQAIAQSIRETNRGLALLALGMKNIRKNRTNDNGYLEQFVKSLNIRCKFDSRRVFTSL